ncbi:MAG: hypothetical protein GF398_21570 [Chitinivibrionales bacterium]|nr:hypothetical protein [Chitinivibrionales bacterium]
MSKVHDIANQSPWFVLDKRKLFLYRPAKKEELARKDDGTMELNEMFALVGKLLPSATGLYKRGARIEEKKCILNFNFPHAA